MAAAPALVPWSLPARWRRRKPRTLRLPGCPSWHRAPRSRRPRRAPSCLAVPGCLPGQLEAERGAVARIALDADPPAMRGHDLVRDPEAEAQPSVGLFRDGALEALENPGLIRGRNPDSLIADGQRRPGRIGLDTDRDRLAAAELHGVGEEVRHHLLQARAVPEAGHRSRRLVPEFTSGAGGAVSLLFRDLPGELAEIDLFELRRQPPRDDARDVQELLGQV